MLLCQATPVASFLDVENNLYYRSITCVYIFSHCFKYTQSKASRNKQHTKKAERACKHFNCTFSSQQIFSKADLFTSYPFLTLITSERRKKYSDISRYKIWVRVAAHIVIYSCQSGSQGHLSLNYLSFRYISIIVRFFLDICNVSIKLCLTKMLVLFIVPKIPISWGIDIVRWWRSVITTKFGQKWNSWLKAADELFWLRYASKTKGMFWFTPSHKIKWQERKPFSRLKCLKQNKTKTKGMLWVTHYHKIKWQERRPSSHLKCL